MSDEDRLRILLRERVAAVPVVADLDDVAARIHRPQHGRSRSLVLIGVLALVVGTVGGFAAGRTGRDSAPEIVAAGASSPSTDGIGVLAPAIAQGSGVNPAPVARLFVRTTADGVTIRTYEIDGPLVKHSFRQSATALTSVEAEMSTDAAVTTTATGWTRPATQALGGMQPGSFGENEQAPAQFVIVQTRSDVARVRASFAGGGTDEMKSEQGVAVLAHRGTGRAVSVSALDSNGHVTFTESVPSTCAAQCSTATTIPPGSAIPAAGSGESLPAPGPHQPADEAAAKTAVGTALAGAFDGGASDATRVRSVEGGDALVGVFDELRHGDFADSVGSAQTVVEGVVFLSPTTATAKFHSHLGSGSDSGPYVADAVLTSTGWQVTRASYCQLAAIAGANCP